MSNYSSQPTWMRSLIWMRSVIWLKAWEQISTWTLRLFCQLLFPRLGNQTWHKVQIALEELQIQFSLKGFRLVKLKFKCKSKLVYTLVPQFELGFNWIHLYIQSQCKQIQNLIHSWNVTTQIQMNQIQNLLTQISAYKPSVYHSHSVFRLRLRPLQCSRSVVLLASFPKWRNRSFFPKAVWKCFQSCFISVFSVTYNFCA